MTLDGLDRWIQDGPRAALPEPSDEERCDACGELLCRCGGCPCGEGPACICDSEPLDSWDGIPIDEAGK